MSSSEPVHFFDLYSDLPGTSKSWSHNTLKTRAVLNFKGIPYTQSWTSYPDIKPLAISLDLPPNENGRPYTLPAIFHNSMSSNPKGALMDSLQIALHLDKAFPSPPLFPSGQASYALFIAVSKIMTLIEAGFRPLIVPRVVNHLDPRGQVYFNETRSKAFGKPLAEVRPTDEESLGQLWDIIERESSTLVQMLKGRNGKKGPFFEGEMPGYADLVYAAQLTFIGRFDKELFGKCMGLGEGVVRDLYTACLPWMKGQGEEREWSIPHAV